MPGLSSVTKITTFGFRPGRIISRRYEIIRCLGSGWEGEVYMVREKQTNILRAIKFFFPHRNEKDRASTFYAKKLHRLRECPILIHYHTQDRIQFKRQSVTFLVSDYVEGELLSDFIKRQPGRRLGAFQALHLVYALAIGIEQIHTRREYHGDLHTENVIVRRHGLGFDLKLVDLFHWGRATRINIADDVCDITRILYEGVGGKKHYPKQPPAVKSICCGQKRSLIHQRFPTAGKLREHLENLEWAD